MFITSKEYEKAAVSILSETDQPLAAVAFWGRGAEKIILSGLRGKLRLICNLKSGGTNPDTIKLLQSMPRVQVRQHDHLHAKVVVGRNRALVGSANFSSNGLNLEAEEIQGWEEAGIVTDDKTNVAEIRGWFDTLWAYSKSVSEVNIREAKTRWLQRRATRVGLNGHNQGQRFTLEVISKSQLRDRPVYLAIYREMWSNDAERAFSQIEEEIQAKPGAGSLDLDAYEDWPNLPKDVPLIDFYYGPNGAVQCDGALTHILDRKFKYRNGKSGNLAICRKEKEVLGYKFAIREAGLLAKSLKPAFAKIWASPKAEGDESAKCILLSSALDLCG